MEKDELEKRMDRVINWVQVCDTKASIIIGVIALFAGWLFATDFFVDGMKDVLNATFFYRGDKEFSLLALLLILFFLLTVISLGVSLYYMIKVVAAKPQSTQTRDPKARTKSLIHFYSVAEIIAESKEKSAYDVFSEMIKSESSKTIEDDYLSQFYINAKRCKEKFDDYNDGIEALKWSFIIMMIYIVVMYLYQSQMMS